MTKPEKPRIAVINFGLGNLYSVSQSLKHAGAEPLITSRIDNIESCDAIVLPGVGAFARAMENLDKFGLIGPLHTEVMEKKKPLLGICLGMQLLFDQSEEFGVHSGLGMISGKVTKFPQVTANGELLRVPNIGWQEIQWRQRPAWLSPMLNETIEDHVYFIHSYFCNPSSRLNVAAVSTFGGQEFCAAVQSDNILATQFHPEKSGLWGLALWQGWVNSIGV